MQHRSNPAHKDVLIISNGLRPDAANITGIMDSLCIEFLADDIHIIRHQSDGWHVDIVSIYIIIRIVIIHIIHIIIIIMIIICLANGRHGHHVRQIVISARKDIVKWNGNVVTPNILKSANVGGKCAWKNESKGVEIFYVDDFFEN